MAMHLYKYWLNAVFALKILKGGTIICIKRYPNLKKAKFGYLQRRY